MGIQSGTEKRAALAYAASEGWIPPSRVVTTTELSTLVHPRVQQLEGQVADLERQIAELKEGWTFGKAAAGSVELFEKRVAEELAKERARIADLDVALTAERESHAVTKSALLRGKGKGAGQRIAALEAALGKLTGDDVTEADIAAAKALLKP